MEVKDLPQTTESTESDHVVSSISQKTRLISFKNIFEKISFSSLATKAKNIIGAINELNTNAIFGFNDSVTKATSAQIYDYSNIIINGKIAIINLSVNVGRDKDLAAWSETILGTINTLKPKYQCVGTASCQSSGLCADIVLNTDGTFKLGTRGFTLPKDEFVRGQIVYILA